MSTDGPPYEIDGILYDHEGYEVRTASVAYHRTKADDVDSADFEDGGFAAAVWAGGTGVHGIDVAIGGPDWTTIACLTAPDALALRDHLNRAIAEFTKHQLAMTKTPAHDPAHEVAAEDMAGMVLDLDEFDEPWGVIAQDKPPCVMIYVKGFGSIRDKTRAITKDLDSEEVHRLASAERSKRVGTGTQTAWVALVPAEEDTTVISQLVSRAIDPKARVEAAFARPQQRMPIRKLPGS